MKKSKPTTEKIKKKQLVT